MARPVVRWATGVVGWKPGVAVCCVVVAVSWATWLLFTGAPARCGVLGVRCPGTLGSCSPVFPLGVLCCVCNVLGHLAPVRRCACSVCCFACAVSWVNWLLFTSVPALSFVSFVRCPGPLGSCSQVCPRGLLCCVCGVLGHLAPVHRCPRSVWCVECALSRAPWLQFTGVPAGCIVLCVPCPGPLGTCSPVRLVRVLLCVRGVLGHFAPVHRCACSVFCFVCAVSWATWLLFTGVPARFVVLRLRCPGPFGSCSPVRPLLVVCCACGVPGPFAPVQRCARWGCCVACAMSWATWLLYAGMPAPCVALRARCPGSLGLCSPVCLLCLLFCLCVVLGHLAPVHRCARVVCFVLSAVSWATWLLFTGVSAPCSALRLWRPAPLGPRSSMCLLGVLCCVWGVIGHLAPVHRCARSVCCFACAMSWATWLLFTGVLALSFVLFVPSCATWLLLSGVPAWRAVLCVRCPGPIGSCSPVCQAVVSRPFVALGARACAVSWPLWRLFTGVRAVCGARVPLVVVSPFICPQLSFFFKWKKKRKNRGARTLQAQARGAGAAVQ